MTPVLDQIRDFADRSHGDQKRKYTPQDRYIVHPERVMNTLKNYTSSLPVLAAALLHDVLEDTLVTKNELFDFLTGIIKREDALRTLSIVEELTDIYTKNNYPEYNRRRRKQKEAERLSKISREAQTIKYADIIDNAPETVDEDPDFAKTFLPEYSELLKVMDRGNPALYHLAKETIRESIIRLRSKQTS